jgi:dipeptidyl aminopeptidase/acylaminoacyl peptidase
MLAALAIAVTPVSAQTPPTPDVAVARAVEAIASIRSAGGPRFSPDGSRIAYISNASGIPQLWVMNSDGSRQTQVTRLSDPVQSVDWSPTGDWLAYDVAPGGGLNVQLYVSRPDGSEVRRLTPGGRENNSLGGWSDDGRWVIGASNRRDAARFEPMLIDPATGEATFVGAGPGRAQLTDLSPDGRFAVLSRLISRGDNNLYLVELASGAETLLTPHTGTGSFSWGEFSPDGRRIHVISNGGRDRAAFGVIDLTAAGAPGPIRIVAERADAEAENAVLSEDGSRAALVWNASGRSEMAWLDTSTGAVTAGPTLPVDILSGAAMSRDGTVLALSGSGATRPGDIHRLDIASGAITQLTFSAHEGVDLASFVRPTLVTYPAHDGLELSGWLYRPRGVTAPGPVVFNYHGGPEGQSRPSVSDVTQALVARGITVFAPNVRGSTGFGKRFMNLDNGPLRVDGVRDIKATTDHLVEAGIADPARLGIMGGSYGGYMVMAGVTEYPDMFAGGANLFGVVNFETFFAQTEPWMAAISTVEYGDPVTQADMLRTLSPIHKIDIVTTPLIVLHGANDTNVPLVEAEQIVNSLKARDVPVEYVLFPDEGHGWRKLPNRIRSTTAIVSFFGRTLGVAN